MAKISPLRPWLRHREAEHIREALIEAQGNVSATARLLDVPHRTLCRRMAALGIGADSYRAMTKTSQPNPLG